MRRAGGKRLSCNASEPVVKGLLCLAKLRSMLKPPALAGERAGRRGGIGGGAGLRGRKELCVTRGGLPSPPSTPGVAIRRPQARRVGHPATNSPNGAGSAPALISEPQGREGGEARKSGWRGGVGAAIVARQRKGAAGMGEILWHRRETRRQTENTNIALQPAGAAVGTGGVKARRSEGTAGGRDGRLSEVGQSREDEAAGIAS